LKIAVYGQAYQEQSLSYVLALMEELDQGDSLAIESDFYHFLGGSDSLGKLPLFTLTEGLDTSFDMFVSFGGDGTILRAVTFVRDLGIPVVGVNTGRLGFLSTFKKEEVRQVIKEFRAGDYRLEPRALIQVVGPEAELFLPTNFALNEITVSRKDTTSMITVETHLNDEYLTSYWADGLIISTPTGSTGYSLSCGGPVMSPMAGSLVITPIAPHNLNARPLVVSDDTVIRLKVSGREDHHLVSLDSRLATVANGTEIRIQKAPFTVPFIQYKRESFYKTLRHKLLWGEDVRN
jgi:NAD+ kinase